MSNVNESTNGGFSNPIFNAGNAYEAACQVGIVKSVNYLSQTIDILSDGHFYANVSVLPGNVAGSGGMSLPSVDDRIAVIKYNSRPYCIAVVPAAYSIPSDEDIQAQAEKIKKGDLANSAVLLPPRFRTSDDVVNSPEVEVNHFIVNSREEQTALYMESIKSANNKKIYEMDSPVTHRELIQPGDSALYRGDAGSKIVGLNKGSVAMIGGTFCASIWNKANNSLKEIADNYSMSHGSGVVMWESDRANGQTNYVHEIWEKPDNESGTKLLTMVGKSVKNGFVGVYVQNNTNKQHLKKKDKWDAATSAGFSLWDYNYDTSSTQPTIENFKIIIDKNGKASLVCRSLDIAATTISLSNGNAGIAIKDDAVSITGDLVTNDMNIKGKVFMPTPVDILDNRGHIVSTIPGNRVYIDKEAKLLKVKVIQKKTE